MTDLLNENIKNICVNYSENKANQALHGASIYH